MQNLRPLLGIICCLAIAALFLAAGGDSGLRLGSVSLFLVSGSIGILLHWLVFIPSFIYQTEKFFDLTGAVSFIATMLIALVNLPAFDTRTLLLAGMVSLWALRLGSLLFLRIQRVGFDRRFADIKPRFWRFGLTWTLGGLWVLVTVAPALAAITTLFQVPLGALGYFAVALWGAGFAIEVVADQQKNRFRRDPANADRFIRSGLWSRSRHPNYFGEILLWFGIALLALPVLAGWQLLTLLSPLFVILLLTRVSGIPLLEKKAEQNWGTDPDYIAYRNSTPTLVPRLF